MHGIPIYAPTAEDFSGNGLGLLLPTECTVEEVAAGMYTLTLVQPITSDLRWSLIDNGCIIKANVPVRESPIYESSATTGGMATITRKIYKVSTNGGRLHLRQKPSTSSKILSKWKPGTEVVQLADAGNGWYQVSIVSGGATGYMYASWLKFDREITETITSTAPDVNREGVKVQPSREQLFRVSSVQKDTDAGTVTATAQHIFYDLRGNIVNDEYAPENVSASEAAAHVFSAALNTHDFTVHTPNLSGTVTGNYGYKSIVEALLDPDEGIVAQSDALFVRDNYDVFLLPDEVRDLGVTVRRGKNLIGVTVTHDETNVVTRIIPVGTGKPNKDGDASPLYIDEKYVDSSHIGDYPVVYAKMIEYDVSVASKSSEAKPEEGIYASEADAKAELKKRASAEFESGIDLPDYGMNVDFILLGNSDEYSQYAGLQSVHMFDTVTVHDSLIQLSSKLRVTGYVWDVLTEQYQSVTLGDIQELSQTIYSYNLPTGGISGTKIATGTMGGNVFRDATIGYAKISVAAIETLAANAITAVSAHINDLVAGTIETNQLYADLAKIAVAQITTANITNANIDWAQITNLTAQIATIAEAQIGSASIGSAQIADLDVAVADIVKADIDWAEIATLNALIANIAQAKVDQLEVRAADIKDLNAVIAQIASAEIGSADIGFAQVKDLVTGTAIITEGVGGELYISRLAVTEANMVSLTVGELVVKGTDGAFYSVTVNEAGEIVTSQKVVGNGDINDNSIQGLKIIEGSIDVSRLNAQSIFADSAIVRELIAANLDVGTLFAREAFIAQLNTTDIRGNEYLKLYVTDQLSGVNDQMDSLDKRVTSAELALSPDAIVSTVTSSTKYTTTINTLTSAASTAQDTADAAQSAADAAQSTANTAKTAASTAQSTADSAKTAASTAQSTADTAKTAASTAQSTANAAKTAASNAQSTADAAQAAAEAAQATANQNAADMATIVTDFNADIANLQSQVDGSIMTWFYEVAPTTSNKPASDWTTTELKNVHLGDLYYNTITGYCYRWQEQNNTYSWRRITDTDVTKALSDAAKAQDTADAKRRVFYSTPTPPYDKGDLWAQGSSGDIMRCQTAKTSSQSYSSSDWVKASKYTDDTTANSALSKANTNAGEITTLKTTVTNQQTQIKQTQDAIALTATKTEVTEAVNAIQVGGRNLIRNSDFSGAFGYWYRRDVTATTHNDDSTYGTYAKVIFDGAGSLDKRIYISKYDHLNLVGETYTLSFLAKAASSVELKATVSAGQTIGLFSLSTNWKKYSATYTAQQTGSVTFWLNSAGTLYLTDVKLEIGNKATDWTPAPEDVDADISAVQSQANTNASNITSLTTRVTSAEQKITPDAIVSTVRSSTAYSNDLAAKANASALSAYAKKTELTQTADSIRAEVSSLGGNNLLHNSGFYFGLDDWTKMEYNVNGDYRTLSVETGANNYRANEVPSLVMHAQNETGNFGATQEVTGLRKNTDYTISGYVASLRCNKVMVTATNLASTVWMLDTTFETSGSGTNLASYTRFSHTFNTGNYSDVRLAFFSNAYGSNAYVWWAQLKLEEGMVATAWSPHASETYTSSIEIHDNQVDIKTGGDLNISSGGFHVQTSDFDMSLVSDDGNNVVMDLNGDGSLTFGQGIHAPNVREAGYGTYYCTTESIGGVRGLAEFLKTTDYRHINYNATADEYGFVRIEYFTGSLCMTFNGHAAPNLYFTDAFGGHAVIHNAIFTNTTGQNLAAQVYGGRVVFNNCWINGGYVAVLEPRYSGVAVWTHEEAAQSNISCSWVFAHVMHGGTLFYSGWMPGGGIANTYGFAIEGPNAQYTTGTSASTGIQTASITGNLGWISTKHSWATGIAYQGYTTGKGECYACIKFTLPSMSSVSTATLTLHRKSGVGKGDEVDIKVYGSATAWGSRPTLGTLYTSRDDAVLAGKSASLDVLTAVKALKAGSIVQLVLYEGDGKTLSGKVYSTDYCAWDSATLDLTYTT